MPVIAVLLALTVAVAVSTTAVAAEPVPRPPVDLVLEALTSHSVVAIGEDHGFASEHEALRALIRDPRIQDAIQDIVVEFGSAAHQETIDAYVNGESVPRRRLVAAWRDSIGGGPLGTWDAPVYRRFFDLVRAVNAGRPPQHRLRVLLADQPVDWSSVNTRIVETIDRDGHMASVIEREVLAKNRKALFIAGQIHILRERAGGPPPPGAPAPNRSTVLRLHESHPGAVYSVILATTIDEEITKTLTTWPIPSFTAFAGTTLGARSSPVPPGAPPSQRFEELGDALGHYAPVSGGRISTLYPKTYTDAEWTEVKRRLRALTGSVVDVFQITCGFGSIDGRGIPQLARGFGLRGEPSGTGAGSAEKARPAAGFVRRAFARHRVVAVGYHPASDQSVDLLAELTLDRGVANRVRTLVVDFGNPLHQRTVDRYVSGKRVSAAALAAVWREADQLLAFDGSRFRAVLEAARKRRLRVVLAGAPIDWDRASRGSVRAAQARQRRLMGRVIARSPGRTLVFTLRRRATALNDAFVIVPMTGVRGAARRQLEDAKDATIAPIAGSWLARLRAGANLGGGRLSARADAVAFLGSRTAQTSTSATPADFPDRYWQRALRRYRLLTGQDLSLARAFPTSDCDVPAPSGEPNTGPSLPGPNQQNTNPATPAGKR